MNPNIQRLYQISQKKSRYILGLMSGTSLDGLDMAYCKITGCGKETKIQLIVFDVIEYSTEFKESIRKVFAKDTVDFPYLTALNSYIAKQHSYMINNFLRRHNIDKGNVDIIASHGQTVMHTPAFKINSEENINATLQIGDGDQIAVNTGIITLSDFRQKHIAAGGEGAPLAVYGDYLMNSYKDMDTILLNIGGIANFTYIPRNQSFASVFVTDTGPGNTLMDTWTRTYFKLPFDANAQIASTGTIHFKLLHQLKSHVFFDKPFPKSTGPELFNLSYVQKCIEELDNTYISHEDILYTLNQFTSDTIAEVIKIYSDLKSAVLMISGGGAHNPLLMSMIKAALPYIQVFVSDELGIPTDAKEAMIFAVLANESIAGNPDIFKGNINIPAISMGKISFPS